MAFPKIAYTNILRNTSAGHTVSSSSTDTGFAVADIHDHRAFKIWKSGVTTSPINIDIDLGAAGAVDADYLGLINHNLNTLTGTVAVLADATPTPTTVRLAASTPGEDAVTYKEFTAPGALRYWRIQIVHSSPPFSAKPFIGELLLGLKTTLTEFMQPGFDPFHKQVEVASERSEGGHYLGATLRGITRRAEIAFGPAGGARAAFTSDLNAFLDNHAFKRLPFIFVLDTADSDFSSPRWLRVPDEADINREAVGGVWSRLILRMPVEEAIAESA